MSIRGILFLIPIFVFAFSLQCFGGKNQNKSKQGQDFFQSHGLDVLSYLFPYLGPKYSMYLGSTKSELLDYYQDTSFQNEVFSDYINKRIAKGREVLPKLVELRNSQLIDYYLKKAPVDLPENREKLKEDYKKGVMAAAQLPDLSLALDLVRGGKRFTQYFEKNEDLEENKGFNPLFKSIAENVSNLEKSKIEEFVNLLLENKLVNLHQKKSYCANFQQKTQVLKTLLAEGFVEENKKKADDLFYKVIAGEYPGNLKLFLEKYPNFASSNFSFLISSMLPIKGAIISKEMFRALHQALGYESLKDFPEDEFCALLSASLYFKNKTITDGFLEYLPNYSCDLSMLLPATISFNDLKTFQTVLNLNKYTPVEADLQYAVRAGSDQITQFLLENYPALDLEKGLAQKDTPELNGKPPLVLAAMEGKVAIMDALIKKGTNLEKLRLELPNILKSHLHKEYSELTVFNFELFLRIFDLFPESINLEIDGIPLIEKIAEKRHFRILNEMLDRRKDLVKGHPLVDRIFKSFFHSLGHKSSYDNHGIEVFRTLAKLFKLGADGDLEKMHKFRRKLYSVKTDKGLDFEKWILTSQDAEDVAKVFVSAYKPEDGYIPLEQAYIFQIPQIYDLLNNSNSINPHSFADQILEKKSRDGCKLISVSSVTPSFSNPDYFRYVFSFIQECGELDPQTRSDFRQSISTGQMHFPQPLNEDDAKKIAFIFKEIYRDYIPGAVHPDQLVGRSPLAAAIIYLPSPVAKTLLEEGVDPNELVSLVSSWPALPQEQSILEAAILHGHWSIVETLLEKGGRLDFRRPNTTLEEAEYRNLLRLVAAEAASAGHLGVLKEIYGKKLLDVNELLVRRNQEDHFNYVRGYGSPALSIAAQGKENRKAVEYILSLPGVDPLMRSNYSGSLNKDSGHGRKPLTWAKRSGNEGIIRLIWEKTLKRKGFHIGPKAKPVKFQKKWKFRKTNQGSDLNLF